MDFTNNRNIIRWVLIFFSMVVVSLILWNTYIFFQQLKEAERQNMQEYAIMAKDLYNEESDVFSDLHLVVGENTTTIPLITVNNKGKMTARNVPDVIKQDTVALRALVEKFKTQNEPIVTNFEGKPFATIYYGNSEIIENIKYYPLALALIMLLFGAVIWFFYRSTKVGEQNKLWAGMAKESAHQIGTPLSSLIGWTTILKDTDVDPSYIVEMEKDITRLGIITDRFSKIGSIPELKEQDIVTQTREAVGYITSRVSKLVTFTIDLPEQPITVKLNESLYAWVIENLIKNGIDAMRGKGAMAIYLRTDVYNVYIRITDSGKGIPKSQWNQVFQPGFTTKKRGWGLGLSLAKRIINDYHNGKIKVAESKRDKGTTFEISIPRI
jgi:two-component sensor histidine kinase